MTNCYNEPTENVVRKFRKQLGWRQDELAMVTGYSRTTISQFESGARPIPTTVKIMLLAFQRLDVDEINAIFNEVFEDEDEDEDEW